MSSPYNVVSLTGRVGNDPEVTILNDGKSTKKTRFSLIERKISVSEPDRWHTIVAYGSRAETVEKFVSKGRSVQLRCMLVYNEWTDPKGVKQKRAELRLEDPPGFLDSVKSGRGSSTPHVPEEPPEEPPVGSGDLEFLE